MNRQSTGAVEGSANISSRTTMVDTYNYMFVKTHRVCVTPKVNLTYVRTLGESDAAI